ncbi:DUF3592 domain-containing protein [Muricoccus radiodurans]|uniref:DUF3592 domain-containing protein n=1 Tax=Muricoccus radiodurans TaxID=2231721 RepID=UPI003CF9D877
MSDAPDTRSPWTSSAEPGPTIGFYAGTEHVAPASPRLARLVGWIFFPVGLLLLALGVWLFLDARAFVARADTAEAVVSSLSRNREGGTAPVFRFVTREGRAVEAPSNVFSSPPAWTVGERATLRYDPAAPERASPATFVGTYLAPAILLPLGVIFTLVGALVLRFTGPRAALG